MTIKLANVSKFYGSLPAVDGVSFSVDKGEIVGILGGPNSGKSTVMRLIAGYFSPTNGRVRVEGRDPVRDAAVRGRIGYLPESTPLPPRMRVDEYLLSRAGLKGLSRDETKRALDMVHETCFIKEGGKDGGKDLGDRLIYRLSSGERQWVGIADCLLGNPDFVLLDEFAAGLDAANVLLARRLIQTHLSEATVILTGRVPAEMEGLCPRVVILDRGRVAADGNLKNIIRKAVDERTVVVKLISAEPVREAFRVVPGVRRVAVVQEPGDGEEKTVRIAVPRGVDLRQEISQICSRRGWLVTGMNLEPVTLEDLVRKY